MHADVCFAKFLVNGLFTNRVREVFSKTHPIRCYVRIYNVVIDVLETFVYIALLFMWRNNRGFTLYSLSFWMSVPK